VTKTKSFNVSYTIMNADGTSSTRTATCEGSDNGNNQYVFRNVSFDLEKDHWGNYELFSIHNN